MQLIVKKDCTFIVRPAFRNEHKYMIKITYIYPHQEFQGDAHGRR
jgi:hypothetical protein